jgi:hypothetical protein
MSQRILVSYSLATLPRSRSALMFVILLDLSLCLDGCVIICVSPVYVTSMFIQRSCIHDCCAGAGTKLNHDDILTRVSVGIHKYCTMPKLSKFPHSWVERLILPIEGMSFSSFCSD